MASSKEIVYDPFAFNLFTFPPLNREDRNPKLASSSTSIGFPSVSGVEKFEMEKDDTMIKLEFKNRITTCSSIWQETNTNSLAYAAYGPSWIQGEGYDDPITTKLTAEDLASLLSVQPQHSVEKFATNLEDFSNFPSVTYGMKSINMDQDHKNISNMWGFNPNSDDQPENNITTTEPLQEELDPQKITPDEIKMDAFHDKILSAKVEFRNKISGAKVEFRNKISGAKVEMNSFPKNLDFVERENESYVYENPQGRRPMLEQSCLPGGVLNSHEQRMAEMTGFMKRFGLDKAKPREMYRHRSRNKINKHRVDFTESYYP